MILLATSPDFPVPISPPSSRSLGSWAKRRRAVCRQWFLGESPGPLSWRSGFAQNVRLSPSETWLKIYFESLFNFPLSRKPLYDVSEHERSLMKNSTRAWLRTIKLTSAFCFHPFWTNRKLSCFERDSSRWCCERFEGKLFEFSDSWENRLQ